jgi:hypothetical protein
VNGPTAPGQRSVLWRVLRYELVMWRSLYRWVFRRPGPPGPPFSYAGAITPVLWAFIVVSAIEVPAVHFLVPWTQIRSVLLVAGIYGVLWMVGMLASYRVHPHTVDGSGVHLRHGGTVHLLVPWDAITEVRIRRRPHEGARHLRLSGARPHRVLEMVVGGQTMIDVALARPLPLLAFPGDPDPVREVRFFADDEKALVATLRTGLGERWPASR